MCTRAAFAESFARNQPRENRSRYARNDARSRRFPRVGCADDRYSRPPSFPPPPRFLLRKIQKNRQAERCLDSYCGEYSPKEQPAPISDPDVAMHSPLEAAGKLRLDREIGISSARNGATVFFRRS